ncbi:MAG: enoyl-CoA hydratase/isomerase family protein [Candidatus Kariarchaeaceae archaeon]|jgi:2-(1,2-epoxy-1,2-dihydrophenyl)acetyl-CoA isomerase
MVLVSETDNSILTLRMEQPGGNKFTRPLLEALLDTFLNPPQDCTGIILTGSGRLFSVGGDLDGMVEGVNDGDPSRYVDDIVPLVNQVILAIRRCPLPVIAAVNGSAAGGALSLVFSCDFVVAQPGAKLSFAFGSLALSPDSGSSIALLEKGFPRSYLLRAFTTGAIATVSGTQEFGVYDAVVDPENLIPEAKSIISELQAGSLWTFSKTKMLFYSHQIDSIASQLDLEYRSIAESCKKNDFQQKVVDLHAKLNP